MKTKLLKQLLRLLLLAVGAGAGMALAFLCVQVHDMTTANAAVPLGTLVLLYGGMGAAGALGGHVLSPRLISWWSDAMAELERRLDAMSAVQLLSMVLWFVGGLVVAALLTQVLHFLGESIFTLSVSALLYVVLGVLGLSIGHRRAEDLARMIDRMSGAAQEKEASTSAKVLDASALMDGRIAAVVRTGVIEGPLLTADFVLAELENAAAAEDDARRLRAQRGLDTARQLQGDPLHPLQVEGDGSARPAEMDVALMTLTRERNATLITADAIMHKAARVAGVRVVNLNDLACALRTVALAGDVLAVRITRDGREAGQGVGYLEDGTMVVVEGGRGHSGETLQATVTSVLQTSAGRMVFAKAE